MLYAVATAGVALAQETFTERLLKEQVNQGIVVLHHDKEIDALVNGLPSGSSAPAARQKMNVDTLNVSRYITDTTTDLFPSTGQKVRMNGYRIQVYVGGNSRDAKDKAQQMESKVRSYFPEVGIYTRFVSPRWLCHVGDFKTREEALAFLASLRDKGGFGDAIVVKCKINAYP